MNDHMQSCAKCGQSKPLAEGFYYETRSAKHLTRCKECIAAYVRTRRKEDGGEGQRMDYQRRKARGLKPKAYAEKTPEERKASYEAVRRWRAKNRDKMLLDMRKRMQLVKSMAYRKAWPVIVQHYGGKCLNCGAADGLCFDHVQPLSDLGHNLVTNGQPLCRKCNTFKGGTMRNKDWRPDYGEWIAELARLNPWIVEAPKPRGWHKMAGGKEETARRKELESGELVMPGREWVPQASNGEPAVGTAKAQDRRQVANQRILDSLLANLPKS